MIYESPACRWTAVAAQSVLVPGWSTVLLAARTKLSYVAVALPSLVGSVVVLALLCVPRSGKLRRPERN